MIEEWRHFLYPLGFLSSLVFGSRFLIQWIHSELRRTCIVTRAFWILSIIGNTLLLIHSVVQVQFHVAIIQTCNAVIAWRNLNLMKSDERSISFSMVINIMAMALLTTTGVFVAQASLSPAEGIAWIRTPKLPWLSYDVGAISSLWHWLGMIGMILFSLRFWVQWWHAEKHQRSTLNPAFWWTSLIGSSLSLIYFARIHDPVNLVGPLFGMVPYVRNLILIKASNS